MIKNILVVLGILFFLSLQAQDVDFIQKMERSDIPIPYTESIGWQVDIDGDYAVVTAPAGSASIAEQAGIAIVYRYDEVQDEWLEIKTLVPSVPKDVHLFGWSAAISGDVIAISELGHLGNSDLLEGDIYIFQKDEGGTDNWGEVKRIVSPSGSLEFFGWAIDVTDSLLVACSIIGDNVFIYERNETGIDEWGLSQTITTPSSGRFTIDVDLEEDLLIFGMINEGVFIHQKDQGGVDNWGLVKNIPQPQNSLIRGTEIQDSIAVIGDSRGNKVRVYKKDEGGIDNWGLVQTIQGSGRFGRSMDLRDSLVIVGAPNADINGIESGKAYIYRLTASDIAPLEEVFVLSPSSPQEEDLFGIDVAIQGDQVLSGATNLAVEDLLNGIGRSFFFGRNEGGADAWGEVLVVDDVNGSLSSYGNTIDTHNDLMVASARQADNIGANKSGAAFLYLRDEGGIDNWGEVKKFVAPNPTSGQNFGEQCKVYEDRIVISDNSSIHIYYQDQGGQDNWGLVKTISQPSDYLDIYDDILVVINGKQMLVFQKDECGIDNWGLLTQLATPPGGIAEINTISIYGDEIMVGDPGRFSAAISHIGKVYHYNRNEGGTDNWGYVESLSASDSFSANHFGSDLSIYDDLLVVSSKNSDSGSARKLYVFENDSSGFEEKKIISGGAGSSFSQFTFSVAATDRYIVTSDFTEGPIGAGYIYARDEGGASNWGLIKEIIPPAIPLDFNAFGLEIGISGNSVFIRSADNGHGTLSGSIYHYEIDKIPFTTEWTILADDQLVIPIPTDGFVFDYTWTLLSDPTVQITGVHTSADGDFVTDFVDAGSYSLEITGRFPHFIGYPVDKLTDVTQWGDVAWRSMRSSFAGWQGTAFSATDRPILSGVTDFTSLFEGATNFNGDISDWKVGSVSNLSKTFHNAASFAGDISGWNIHKVTNLDSTFFGAAQFNSNIGGWITRNATSMVATFQDAILFDQDISDWEVGNITDFTSTFEDATSFNQPIGSWDVSQCESFDRMFHGCTSFNQMLESWKFSQTASVVDVFEGATGFTCETWSPTIIGWHVNNLEVVDFEIGGPAANYDSLAAEVRLDLLARGWTINGTEVMGDCSVLASKYWTGLIDNDWDNADNWIPKAVPIDGEYIIIGKAINEPILDVITAELLSIDIEDGGSLMIEASGILNVNASLTANVNGISLLGEDVSLVNQGSINIDSTNVALSLSGKNASFDNEGQLHIASSSSGVLFGITEILFSNTDSIMIEGASKGLHLVAGALMVTNSGYISVESTSTGVEMEGSNAQLINDGHLLLEACTDGVLFEGRDNNKRPTLINNNQLDILDIINNSMASANSGGNLTNSTCAILNTSNGIGDIKGVIINDGLISQLGGGYAHTGSYIDNGFQFDPFDSIPDDNTTILDLAYTLDIFNEDVDGDGVSLCEGDVPDDIRLSFKSEWTQPGLQLIEIAHEPGLQYDYFYCIVNVENSSIITCKKSRPTDSSLTFPLDTAGIYELRVIGDFPAMKTYDPSLLGDITQWGDMVWQTMESMFSDWTGTSFTATDAPDLSQVTSLEGMFNNAINFNMDLSSWDVSNISNMRSVFESATNFNGDVVTWDISNVTDMQSMFRNADSFNQPIGEWNITNVQNMKYMLRETDGFNQNLDQWVFQQSTNLDSIFHDLTGMDCVTLSNTLLGWHFNNLTITDKNLGSSNSLQYWLFIQDALDELEARGWVIPGTGIFALCGTQLANKYWVGNSSNNWIEIENWTPYGQPVLGENVIILNRTNQPILSTVTPAINSIKIYDGAILTITPTGNLNLKD